MTDHPCHGTPGLFISLKTESITEFHPRLIQLRATLPVTTRPDRSREMHRRDDSSPTLTVPKHTPTLTLSEVASRNLDLDFRSGHYVEEDLLRYAL